MLSLLESVQWFFFVASGLPLLYLAVLTLVALSYRRRTEFPASRRRLFAFIIPAHNEASSIETTIASVRSVDYPGDRFDVIVVADNCTDATAQAAERAGAMVLVRTNPDERGKGYALRWGMERLLAGSRPYEAFVVIDADSTISPGYLDAMNHAIDQGARSMQSTDIVAPGRGSWSAEMIRISFLLFNVVRPLGRRMLGLSAGLRGNGMCLTAEVLRMHPWSAYSRAEDVEYGVQLLLEGIPTIFVPEASVYAVMPQEARNARSQRARWEGGRADLVRRYAWPLLRMGIRRLSTIHLDGFIDLVTPSIVNMTAIATGFWILSVALAAFGVQAWSGWTVRWTLVLGCAMFHLVLGLRVAGADRGTVAALVQLPRYLAWKAGLYLHIVRQGGGNEWIRTTRESSPLSRHGSFERAPGNDKENPRH